MKLKDVFRLYQLSSFIYDLFRNCRFMTLPDFAKLQSAMKFKLIILFFFVLVLAAAGGGIYWYYNFLNTPRAHDKTNQFIQIPRGSSPVDITNKLEAEGIIANALALQAYLRLNGIGANLKAGEYQFKSPITPLQVVAELEKGEERTTRLTVPEGWTRYEIAREIAEKFPQNPPVDEKAILALMDDTTLIKDFDPNAKNLEGYLFPSTYSLPRETTPKQIIKIMVDQFKKVWKAEWNVQAQALGKSPREIVTIASLIETESKKEDERPIVASVIYNRLNKNIPLGIDQTNVYIAKMLGRWEGEINKSDLTIIHPYNTRINAGLPPGPISSPSESALKAALSPAQTDFIFYVRDPARNDGSHNFYNNAADFERGKAVYQKWLEEQRQIKREQQANGNN